MAFPENDDPVVSTMGEIVFENRARSYSTIVPPSRLVGVRPLPSVPLNNGGFINGVTEKKGAFPVKFSSDGSSLTCCDSNK